MSSRRTPAFFTLFRPQNRGLVIYYPPRPPSGLIKDETFYGFFGNLPLCDGVNVFLFYKVSFEKHSNPHIWDPGKSRDAECISKSTKLCMCIILNMGWWKITFLAGRHLVRSIRRLWVFTCTQYSNLAFPATSSLCTFKALCGALEWTICKTLSIVYMTNMESRQNGSIENIKRQIAITLRTGHTRNRGIGDHLFCLPQAIIEQLKVVQNSGNLNKLGLEYCKYKMLMEFRKEYPNILKLEIMQILAFDWNLNI